MFWSEMLGLIHFDLTKCCVGSFWYKKRTIPIPSQNYCSRLETQDWKKTILILLIEISLSLDTSFGMLGLVYHYYYYYYEMSIFLFFSRCYMSSDIMHLKIEISKVQMNQIYFSLDVCPMSGRMKRERHTVHICIPDQRILLQAFKNWDERKIRWILGNNLCFQHKIIKPINLKYQLSHQILSMNTTE